MTFVLRMAARETRAAWRRLLFFFLCIAIGVGAIAALRSAIQNVRAVLTGQARTLLAADVLVSSSQPLPPDLRRTIDRRLAEHGVTARTESIETPTMVRPADASRATARMVELRAVQPGFPLYGRLELAGGHAYTPDLLRERGVLVRGELLTGLGVAIGESLLIGGQPFTIRGVIENEPGSRAGGFSFGPRVLIASDALEGTGLLSFGSRARYALMVRVPESRVEPLVAALKRDLRNTFVNVRSFRNTEDELGEDLLRAENYLSLVGLAVVILGGIGVSSVTRVFVDQKLKSIAVLKCVGAGTRQVIAVYVVQVLLLGVAGSLAGLVLGRLALAAVPDRLGSAPSSFALPHTLTGPAAAQAFGIGVLVSLLFSLVPLLAIRHVKPSLLLRQETVRSRGIDWLRLTTMIAVASALVALAAWQAASWRIGLAVCGGFAVLAVVLHFAGLGLVRVVRPLSRSRRFALRHAVLHLNRPGNQTRVVLLAVGLGTFFILGIRGVQANLLREFSIDVTDEMADMFLIDVQQDQVAPLAAFLRPRVGAPPRIIPVLRARVTQVRGRAVNLENVEDVRGRGSLGREYTITYRPTLERNERVTGGRFWPATPSSEPEVSIEQSLHERFRIDVGDTIRFDVLGQPIVARVTSIREVNWRDSRAGGFMFVFRPGVLERAPHAYIAPLRGPASAEARGRLQRDLVTAFPNVSVVDVREVLATVRSMLGYVTLGITVVGGLVLVTGVLILIGAVAMTKFRRVYEAAILKTLGASSRLVGSVLLVEYGLLGLLAGTIGALGGTALGWSLSRFVFDIRWQWPLADTLAGLLVTSVLVAVVGLVASLDVLRGKPLATLRAE